MIHYTYGELPWWANEDLQVAVDPECIGYWERREGQPFDESQCESWKEGWSQCDSEIEYEAEKPR